MGKFDSMTDVEYLEFCIKDTKKELRKQLAAIEHPLGDELSDILLEALDKIEQLEH